VPIKGKRGSVHRTLCCIPTLSGLDRVPPLKERKINTLTCDSLRIGTYYTVSAMPSASATNRRKLFVKQLDKLIDKIKARAKTG
jgi:hypothetical protein